jgi:DNA modification methylase
MSIEVNKIYNVDCIKAMKTMEDGSVDFVLTDVPYDAINQYVSNGLRELNKDKADEKTFELGDFLEEVYRLTNNSICIFCGKEQFSTIFSFFSEKKGTTRAICWQKKNPSPMNGQYIYLSGIELAVWFKKPGGGTFNAHCKNTVFRYPLGSGKLHPTEKHHGLLKELILDNSNEGDIVFDPCAGSGAHLLVAKENGRQYLGCELYEPYYETIKKRGL